LVKVTFENARNKGSGSEEGRGSAEGIAGSAIAAWKSNVGAAGRLVKDASFAARRRALPKSR
jgi:hypothetical protein